MLMKLDELNQEMLCSISVFLLNPLQDCRPVKLITRLGDGERYVNVVTPGLD